MVYLYPHCEIAQIAQKTQRPGWFPDPGAACAKICDQKIIRSSIMICHIRNTDSNDAIK